MQKRPKYFWVPAFITLTLVGLMVTFHLASNIPFLNQLLAMPGPPGIIALLVLSITLFCLTRLSFRRIAVSGEMRRIQQALVALQKGASQGEDAIPAIQKILENSVVEQRLQLARKRLAETGGSESAMSLMSGQSGIDDSYLQIAYGPIRALVWALPAFGFMGTAFEMASAVGGLGMALSQTQGYNDLRDLLVNQVVPHLASAFNITIFALSCSVLGFLFLSVVHASEEATLLEADALCLQILSRQQEKQPVIAPTPLPAEIQALTEQLHTLNTSLARLQEDGGVGSLIPLLNNANSTLEAMREGLEQDMILTRPSRQKYRRGGLQP